MPALLLMLSADRALSAGQIADVTIGVSVSTVGFGWLAAARLRRHAGLR